PSKLRLSGLVSCLMPPDGPTIRLTDATSNAGGAATVWAKTAQTGKYTTAICRAGFLILDLIVSSAPVTPPASGTYRSQPVPLILGRRSVHLVDNQHAKRAFLGLQLQPKLTLEGGEESRSGIARGVQHAGCGGVGADCPGPLRRKEQVEVICFGQPGLVHHGAVKFVLHDPEQIRNRLHPSRNARVPVQPGVDHSWDAGR